MQQKDLKIWNTFYSSEDILLKERE
jgi:hypothetical protein